MEAANKENDSDECILVDEEIAPTNEPKTPMQPNRTSQKDPASNQVLNSDISRDLIKSAEKIEKNIKTTPRPQSAKKKQEEQVNFILIIKFIFNILFYFFLFIFESKRKKKKNGNVKKKNEKSNV